MTPEQKTGAQIDKLLCAFGWDVQDYPHIQLCLMAFRCEQTRIVTEVERRLSAVEELEAGASANLQRAKRLRQTILKKAFSGRL